MNTQNTTNSSEASKPSVWKKAFNIISGKKIVTDGVITKDSVQPTQTAEGTIESLSAKKAAGTITEAELDLLHKLENNTVQKVKYDTDSEKDADPSDESTIISGSNPLNNGFLEKNSLGSTYTNTDSSTDSASSVLSGIESDGNQSNSEGPSRESNTSTQDTQLHEATSPTVTDVATNSAMITDSDAGVGTFTVAVTFSEAMNTSVVPTLTFSPSASSTLNFTGGVWSENNTIYTATYDVSDVNADLANITIDVSDARDALGNPQEEYTPAIEFSIDMLNPTVTDVTVNDILITDSDVGVGTFTVAVTFSETMDIETEPTLSFDQDVSSTLSFTGGVWSNGNTVYTATYDVSDVDVNLTDITIDVTGGQDANGNTQVDYTPSAEFDIDTFTPLENIFYYTSTSDSPLELPDIITGFRSGIDKIDLSAIDANTGSPDNEAFTYGGENINTLAHTITWSEDGENTIVQIDNSGDTTAEMQIILTGTNLNLTETDFVL